MAPERYWWYGKEWEVDINTGQLGNRRNQEILNFRFLKETKNPNTEY
jgi:hypothetical protein